VGGRGRRKRRARRARRRSERHSRPWLRRAHLPALGADARARLAAGRAGHAEVAVCDARRAAAAQQDGLRARRPEQRELVKGEALAARLDDARARALGETHRRNAERLELRAREAHVVRHGAHDDGDLVLLARHVARDAREAHGRAVHARHHQPLQDDAIEPAVRTAREEAVELRGGGRGAGAGRVRVERALGARAPERRGARRTFESSRT
jgi:hypothetical protein